MKKKIAYCLPSLYIAGGMERVLTLKANYLAQAGYEVFLILTDGKGKENWYETDPAIRIIQLDINFDELWELPLRKKIIAYLRKQRIYKRRLAACLADIRPDITVSMMRREINFLCSLRDGSKKIGEIHTNRRNFRHVGPQEGLPGKILGAWWSRQLIRKIKKLDRFVVLCEEDKAQYPPLRNIRVIPNPLPCYPEQVSDGQSRQVIAVARYSHEKGIDLLLQAWQKVQEKHPDYILNIYGAGDSTPYEQQARELGLGDNCRLNKATSDILARYCESALSVLSSRFEGFGMVLIESMACGVPPVAFACPCGPRDIITDGENGLLVENGNTDQLAEKICFLIEHPQLRRQMGEKAREEARRYQLPHIMEQWINLFENM